MSIATAMKQLEYLCELTSSDFGAIATATGTTAPRFRWEYAYGHRSERYKHMIVKPGLGPAGLALRTGRPVNWSNAAAQSAGMNGQCPLMSAEQLQCAAAFPIMQENRISGILLVGRRGAQCYHDDEFHDLRKYLHNLA